MMVAPMCTAFAVEPVSIPQPFLLQIITLFSFSFFFFNYIYFFSLSLDKLSNQSHLLHCFFYSLSISPGHHWNALSACATPIKLHHTTLLFFFTINYRCGCLVGNLMVIIIVNRFFKIMSSKRLRDYEFESFHRICCSKKNSIKIFDN